MPWSVSAEPSPEWADPVLLTVGRATYIAQNFENNCKDLRKGLRFGKQLMGLVDVEPDRVREALDEIVDELADRRFTVLGNAVKQLVEDHPDVFSTDAKSILLAAKEARNWIAHEGARFNIRRPDPSDAVDCLRELLPNVRALAVADELVARVKWETEESNDPEADGPPLEVGNYELLVERWVFKPVAGLPGAPKTR